MVESPDAGEGNQWERVGPSLLRGELATQRFALGEAFRDAEDALREDGQVTPEHVTALRMALNQALETIEDEVAPVAGVEPWGGPPPSIPNPVLWDWTDHPNAEGVDPREYIDGGDDEQ